LLSFPVDAPANNAIATTAFDGFAMDFNGAATTLYGINQPTITLGTIDLVTGAYNTVAPISGEITGTTNFGGMSYNKADGKMYVLGSTAAGHDLYTVNLATGVLTHIAAITGGTGLFIDIAIDNNGNAFLNNISDDSL